MSQRRRSLKMLMVAGLVAVCASGASATIIIDTVPVGNLGNAGELSGAGAGDFGPSAIVGGVAYTYNIGKYEVTAGQYTAFLNAVAVTDTFGLYNTNMANPGNAFTTNIQRSGSQGSYTYSVASAWANRPVNFVSWGDAARFANWLHNGQPTGPQGLATTEDGSYFVNGATFNIPALLAITRKPGATWVIPTEDEWYKAAYYDPNKPGGAGYWDYPTRSDTIPSNVLDPTGTNNANYALTIGAPYYRTEVGAFAASPSAYGTFDQGGNVWEWNEAIIPSDYRGVRGGAFNYNDYNLRASYRDYNYPSYEPGDIGFRVAFVPEPSTLAMLAFVGAGVFGRRRGCHSSARSGPIGFKAHVRGKACRNEAVH